MTQRPKHATTGTLVVNGKPIAALSNVAFEATEAVRFVFRMAGLIARLRRVYERKKASAPMGPVRLAGLRVAFGLSKGDFAAVLGVGPFDVSLWEEGDTAPSREISAVLRTLDCPANRRLFGPRRR